MKLQNVCGTILLLTVIGASELRSEDSKPSGILNLPVTPFRYSISSALRTAASNAKSNAEVLRKLDNTAQKNPISDAGATLGRVLFYDRKLSRNDTVSCASCHEQQFAFSDPRRFSIGHAGGKTQRNSMSLINLRFTRVLGNNPGFFWDERAPTLEAQVLMPIQDQVEMGMTLPRLARKLQKLSYYPPLFKAAFGSPQATSDRIARAVAQFTRSMESFDSKFDRAAKTVANDYSKDFPDFSAAENLGKSLFIDGLRQVAEIGCAHCHVPPTFSMPTSFNNGLNLVSRDKGLGARNVPTNDPFTPSNDGKFKASSLRNVTETAPYMHDGRFKSLEQVLDHYSDGVHPHPNLGLATPESIETKKTKTSGFRYSKKQKTAIITFLKTLSGKSILTDKRFSDPFVRQAKPVHR